MTDAPNTDDQTLRAIVEALAAREPSVGTDMGFVCGLCGAEGRGFDDRPEHRATCPYLRAQAFGRRNSETHQQHQHYQHLQYVKGCILVVSSRVSSAVRWAAFLRLMRLAAKLRR